MVNKQNRRISPIMFTDIIVYTSLMQKDETAEMKIRSSHPEAFEKYHNEYLGKIVPYYVDGADLASRIESLGVAAFRLLLDEQKKRLESGQ